jgi:hypothetical protein
MYHQTAQKQINSMEMTTTHDYVCAKNHDSKTCEVKWREEGHKEVATGDNPTGGTTKDKKNSK